MYVNSLAYAIRLGRIEIIKKLLEVCGANIERSYQIYEEAGKTPLDTICENGYLDVLEY